MSRRKSSSAKKGKSGTRPDAATPTSERPGSAARSSNSPAGAHPIIRPFRRRPWFLAIAAFLWLGWLAFLIAIALRG